MEIKTLDLNLNKRTVIVTGAARGIGKAIALTFAREGANVVVSDIDLEEAKKVAAKVRTLGVQALPIRADVTKTNEVKTMVNETVK